jgi:hypothetical protein
MMAAPPATEGHAAPPALNRRATFVHASWREACSLNAMNLHGIFAAALYELLTAHGLS